jgi:hypothetical protein
MDEEMSDEELKAYMRKFHGQLIEEAKHDPIAAKRLVEYRLFLKDTQDTFDLEDKGKVRINDDGTITRLKK